jgi:hypothetical protein
VSAWKGELILPPSQRPPSFLTTQTPHAPRLTLPNSAVRRDAYDKEHIWRYYHNECSLVTPNKQDAKTKTYVAKATKVAGAPPVLTCQPHYRAGTKGNLAENYLMSEECAKYQNMSGLSISRERAAECVCDCMKVLTHPPIPTHMHTTPPHTHV